MHPDIHRLSSFQLPNKFIKIGIGVAILAFLGLIAIKASNGSEALIHWTKQLMLVGMLLISISRDKEEDELIVKLRMQSYAFAFILAIAYALALPLVDYGIDQGLKGSTAEYHGLGDFMILWLLLSVQVLTFYVLKRSYA